MKPEWKRIAAVLVMLSALAGCDPGDSVPQPQVDPDETRQER